MLVVDEKQMRRVGGVRVVVLMKRVAVGRTAGGVEQAVGSDAGRSGASTR